MLGSTMAHAGGDSLFHNKADISDSKDFWKVRGENNYVHDREVLRRSNKLHGSDEDWASFLYVRSN